MKKLSTAQLAEKQRHVDAIRSSTVILCDAIPCNVTSDDSDALRQVLESARPTRVDLKQHSKSLGEVITKPRLDLFREHPQILRIQQCLMK